MSALHGQEVGASRRAGTAALSSERVRVANAFIEENLARRVTARAMAEAAGLSVWHFSRAYKGATGTTPHKVVLEMRMLRADARISIHWRCSPRGSGPHWDGRLERES